MTHCPLCLNQCSKTGCGIKTGLWQCMVFEREMSEMRLLFVLILLTGCASGKAVSLQDDGYGTCPAFQHSHLDGQCYDNDDNLVLPTPTAEELTQI